MNASRHTPRSPSVPELQGHTPDGRVLRFSAAFHIGRDHDCDVRVNDVHVSRKHVAASFAKGIWRLKDLNSANGMFVDGKRVETASIDDSVSIKLGTDGPSLTFEVEGASKRRAELPQTVQQAEGETRLLASYEERYFGSKTGQERVGGRTMMIRRAFQKVQKKQRRQYWALVALAGIAIATAISYAIYKHVQEARQQEVAEELFYQMKTLDVDLAKLEQRLAPTDQEGRQQVRGYLARRRELESTYDKFLTVLNLYDSHLSEEDRLILRGTRRFGGGRSAAPPPFLRKGRN